MKNIKVYTINNCGFCEAAKTLLKSLNLAFEEFNLTNDEEGRLNLVRQTGHRTMPQIFVDDQFVGGYRELKEFLQKK